MKLSRVLAASLAVGILAVSAPVAAAHDVVVGGEPADQAVLEEFPDEVSLEFSGYIQEDFNTFAVSDVATDEVLFSGEPAIDGRWARLEVPGEVDPGDGQYRIGFQITSSDGHSTRGMTTFTVGEAKPAEETEQAPVSEEESGGLVDGPLAWVLGAVGILAILGVIAMAIARGRNTPQE